MGWNSKMRFNLEKGTEFFLRELKNKENFNKMGRSKFKSKGVGDKQNNCPFCNGLSLNTELFALVLMRVLNTLIP